MVGFLAVVGVEVEPKGALFFILFAEIFQGCRSSTWFDVWFIMRLVVTEQDGDRVSNC